MVIKELSSCRDCTNNDDKLNKCRVLNKETPEKGFLINCPFMGGGEHVIPKSMYHMKESTKGKSGQFKMTF